MILNQNKLHLCANLRSKSESDSKSCFTVNCLAKIAYSIRITKSLHIIRFKKKLFKFKKKEKKKKKKKKRKRKRLNEQ